MLVRLKQADVANIFDLIVIGGGINGCGIARDASERGLKVCLLEKEDFGSGCTSASTRLIHGGLRYLEYFEFPLVKESLSERELLLKKANHLVKPLELCMLVYKNDRRSLNYIKAGLIFYDLLSVHKSLPKHKFFLKDNFVTYEPFIEDSNLLGGAIYYDAQALFPERICLENILMAKSYGALTLNHAEVKKITFRKNRFVRVDFFDKLSGLTYSIFSRFLVNASGPWVDQTIKLTKQVLPKKIGGTKGSHIVVKKFPEGPQHALYCSSKADSRPFFIIPWLSNYLIGTTDILFNEDLDLVSISSFEIDYLINEFNNISKIKKISKSDILFSYAGIRALPFSPGTPTGSITRKYIIFDHKTEGIDNFISIVGGKLTTYRALSEKTVDLVYRKLKYKFIKSRTSQIPLIGAFNFKPDHLSYLESIYGSIANRIIDLINSNQKLNLKLSNYSQDILAQVYYAINFESAYTLSDILLRRLPLGFSDDLGESAIPKVIEVLKTKLNYSESELKEQIEEYQNRVIKLRKI